MSGVGLLAAEHPGHVAKRLRGIGLFCRRALPFAHRNGSWVSYYQERLGEALESCNDLPNYDPWRTGFAAFFISIDCIYWLITCFYPCAILFTLRSLPLTCSDENAWNCFDPQYQLPDGKRARCILDWERRHLEIEAPKKGLNIIYVKPNHVIRMDYASNANICGVSDGDRLGEDDVHIF